MISTYQKYMGGKGRWSYDSKNKVWYDNRLQDRKPGSLKASHGTLHQKVAGKMVNGKWDPTAVITAGDGSRWRLNADGTTTRLQDQKKGNNGRVTYTDRSGNVYDFESNRRIVHAEHQQKKPNARRQYIIDKLNDKNWKLSHPFEANGLQRELAEMNGRPISFNTPRVEDLGPISGYDWISVKSNRAVDDSDYIPKTKKLVKKSTQPVTNDRDEISLPEDFYTYVPKIPNAQIGVIQ